MVKLINKIGGASVAAMCMLPIVGGEAFGEETSTSEDVVVVNDSVLCSPTVSHKLTLGHGNPLLDFHFTADPTAVEYDGRLYVYATNDHQQYEAVGSNGKNSYEKIKSLVMMSTDDMVNWTYHGIIDVDALAPWIIASWAPSITKKVDSDGVTHFYLYFSNSGFGTSVLTATHPLGPWSSPLEKSLVDAETPGLGECKVPFDPGVVIDDEGVGWLAVGAGNAVLMRLGEDMISIDSDFIPMPAPHHFEANELNYINGKYVYTYNTDWQDHSDWPYEGEVPTMCSMCYMTSETPLDAASWQYGRPYLKNSGDYGYTYTNNHTHLHKYNDKWYIFYHSMELQKNFDTEGGFRNVCVDEIEVDEDRVEIKMADQTLKGVEQIHPLNPFVVQQAETTAATKGVRFDTAPDGKPGNMVASPCDEEGIILVKGVGFEKMPKRCEVKAEGSGVIEIRKDAADGLLIAAVPIDSSTYDKSDVSSKGTGFIYNNVGAVNLEAVSSSDVSEGVELYDLYFILKGNDLKFDNWQFK